MKSEEDIRKMMGKLMVQKMEAESLNALDYVEERDARIIALQWVLGDLLNPLNNC